MRRTLKLLLASLLLHTAPAWPQAGGADSPRNGANTSSSTADDGDHQRSERPAAIALTVYQRGRALLASGGPPPLGTGVEMVCRGGESVETSTARDGRFSFSLTARVGAFKPDATGNVGIPRVGEDPSYAGCQVRVLLQGHKSRRAPGQHSPGANGDLGLFVLFPIRADSASVVSVTSFEAPADARNAYRRGVKELARKNPNLGKAVAALQQATAKYPAYAAAWTALGRTLARRRDFDAARDALGHAIAADAAFVEPYPLLAGVALEQQDWPTVVRAAERTLALRAGDTQAYYYLALGRMGLQQFDQAEQSAQRVAESPLADRFPGAFHILGAIHVLEGRFPAAQAAFERYLQLRPDSPLSGQMRTLIAEWLATGKLDAASPPEASPNRLLGTAIP